MVNWLATEVERAISAHKEKLPTKSRKFKFPQVFWVLPVFHSGFKDNQYREKFIESTINMIAKHRGMHTLRLHAWNPPDRHLVINSTMTDQGYRRYRSVVNDAYMAWDKQEMKKSHAHVSKFDRQPFGCQRRFDRYHWSSKNCEVRSPKPSNFWSFLNLL